MKADITSLVLTLLALSVCLLFLTITLRLWEVLDSDNMKFEMRAEVRAKNYLPLKNTSYWLFIRKSKIPACLKSVIMKCKDLPLESMI